MAFFFIRGEIMLSISLALCVLVLCGVSPADTVSIPVSVKEGDSVTLNTGVKKNPEDRIRWYFNDIRIAQIIGDVSNCTDVQCEDSDQRFRDRLKLDHQTGSLTIMNTRNTDEGEYQLDINSRNIEMVFNVAVRGVSAAERDEMKRKSVKEGESVTLNPGVTKNPDDVLKWYFDEILITEITGDQNDQCDERFRDRLKLDHQTGSLTIMNTRITDEGEYKLQMIVNRSSFSITRVKRFSVSVTGLGLTSSAVVGITVAVLVAVAGSVAAVIYYRKYRAKGSRNRQNPIEVNGLQYSLANQKEEFINGTHHDQTETSQSNT